ncbi:hypothetical protein CH373_18505, partial [Leptospira perolatii]
MKNTRKNHKKSKTPKLCQSDEINWLKGRSSSQTRTDKYFFIQRVPKSAQWKILPPPRDEPSVHKKFRTAEVYKTLSVKKKP